MTPARNIDLIAYLLMLATALALGGCGDSSGTDGALVRDSAGIRIVENSDPLWPQGSGWQLSKKPVLEIGELEGEPEYQLYRVADARRLSDGRVVVANAGTNELRFYDRKGRFLSAAGREGGGPGEFQGLSDLWSFVGDSLLAYDFRNSRVSIFDPSGAFVRSFQLQGLTGTRSFPSVIGPLVDGSLLVDARLGFGGADFKGGLRRDSTAYLRCDREGALVDSLGWFPGPEWYVRTQERGMIASTRAFGRRPYAAAHAAIFYFGGSDSYEIARYDTSGALTSLIRKAQPNLAVTAEDIEAWKEEELEDAEDQSQRILWERLYADMPFPKTMPAHDRLVVDEAGNLWVADYRRPGDEQPRWTVFGPEGRMLGTVDTPPNFRVYQIGTDFVLGRWRDQLDVEHVRLYRLNKG